MSMRVTPRWSPSCAGQPHAKPVKRLHDSLLPAPLTGQDAELHEEVGGVEVRDLGLHQPVLRDRYPHEDREREPPAGRRPSLPSAEVSALDVGLEKDVALSLVIALVAVAEVRNGGIGALVPLANLVLAP